MSLWKNSDWTNIRREVRHKQSEIYEAALKNDKLVHLLQKELTKSLSAKMGNQAGNSGQPWQNVCGCGWKKTTNNRRTRSLIITY